MRSRIWYALLAYWFGHLLLDAARLWYVGGIAVAMLTVALWASLVWALWVSLPERGRAMVYFVGTVVIVTYGIMAFRTLAPLHNHALQALASCLMIGFVLNIKGHGGGLRRSLTALKEKLPTFARPVMGS